VSPLNAAPFARPVTENANEGSDAAIVLISSYTLAANVDGATFLTSGVSITGNGLNNRIYGSADADIDGNGAGAAMSCVLPAMAQRQGGATFVRHDAAHWQINSADGTIHDTIALSNGASVDVSDWLFV
jgi:hypothetical protein